MKKYLQNITTGVIGEAPLKRQSCFDKRGFVSQEKGPEMRSFFFERISAKYGILGVCLLQQQAVKDRTHP